MDRGKGGMNEAKICQNCGKESSGAGVCFCPFCGTALQAAQPECGGLTDAVRARYAEYDMWVRSVHKNQAAARVLTMMITGDRTFKNSPEHERFLTDVEKLSEELIARYRAGDARETLPELLQFVLIDCHDGVDQDTDWMFLAAEKVFIPLLELLTQEEAAALYPPYKQLRRKQPGLEIQKNIRKSLKKTAGG